MKELSLCSDRSNDVGYGTMMALVVMLRNSVRVCKFTRAKARQCTGSGLQ